MYPFDHLYRVLLLRAWGILFLLVGNPRSRYKLDYTDTRGLPSVPASERNSEPYQVGSRPADSNTWFAGWVIYRGVYLGTCGADGVKIVALGTLFCIEADRLGGSVCPRWLVYSSWDLEP